MSTNLQPLHRRRTAWTWKCIVGLVLVLMCVQSRTSTLISNMNIVFETFNPVSLVRFFEFNDKGWNISAGCIQDMFHYLDGLHRDIQWAVKLYDASGYYSGGIMDLNHIRTGNPELCRKLQVEYLTQQKAYHQLQPNYMRLPFGVRLVNAKYKLTLQQNISMSIIQTVCMPTSCLFNDLKQVMSYAHLPQMRNHVHVRHVELIKLRTLESAYSVWTDLCFSVIVVITTTIIVVLTCATVYEQCAANRNQNKPVVQRFVFAANTSFTSHVEMDTISKISSIEMNSMISNNLRSLDPPKSLDTVKDSLIIVKNIAPEKLDNIEQARSLESQVRSVDSCNNNHLKKQPAPEQSVHQDRFDKYSEAKANGQIFKSFSVTQIISQLVDGSGSWTEKAEGYKEDVSVVGGLRVLCCLSIIAVHLCVFLMHISNNNRSQRDNIVFSTLLSNGSVAVDMYFFLSGISMAHRFYMTVQIIDVHQICSAIDQLLLFFSMILYKLIRLTFPYLVVLLLLQLSMKYLHDFSVISIPSEDHLSCQDHMWKNILYIDTFFPVIKRCMVWSWYISLEAQFCIIASIVLLLAKTHPKYASIISASFFTSSIVTTTILRFNEREKLQQQMDHNNFNIVSVEKDTYEQELFSFNGVYDQPWTRVSPYLLGLCLGYILHTCKYAVKMHYSVNIFGWFACFSVFIGYVLRPLFVDKLAVWIRSGMASITQTIWSIVLFWVVLSSLSPHKGFLGRFIISSKWSFLSKLSNCVLIVHPLVTRVVLLNMDHSIHLSLGLYLIMYIGFVVLIYLTSFVLFIIFEAPFVAIFNFAYNRYI